ncbi:MAG: OB-fold nucleic acid binding domain-containing protein [Candidatus Hadarchaeales archaeon]
MYFPAYKVKAEDLLFGKVEVSEESGLSLITPWGIKIKRARLLGTVVDKYVKTDGTYGVINVDDGSGVIRVKVWREDLKMIENIKEGDIVDVIGRIKERDGEVYITPDVIIKVTDPNFEILRELEILEERWRLLKSGKKPNEEISLKERIVEVLRREKKRMGVEEISKLLEAPMDEIERLLRELLAEGKIVESEVGKFEVI